MSAKTTMPSARLTVPVRASSARLVPVAQLDIIQHSSLAIESDTATCIATSIAFQSVSLGPLDTSFDGLHARYV